MGRGRNNAPCSDRWFETPHLSIGQRAGVAQLEARLSQDSSELRFHWKLAHEEHPGVLVSRNESLILFLTVELELRHVNVRPRELVMPSTYAPPSSLSKRQRATLFQHQVYILARILL